MIASSPAATHTRLSVRRRGVGGLRRCDTAVVEPIGPKLAEGRDTEIYVHGPGRVLRVPRDGRSLVREAEIMRFVADCGYPVPAVHDAGEGYLVMDQVAGPVLLASAVSHPERIPAYGRLLAELHSRLHQITAPPWLAGVEGADGDSLVHRDLHPLNVLLGSDGPVVIDWANAARGNPAYDVADTWVLFATFDIPGDPSQRQSLAAARMEFLRYFLDASDADAARAFIPLAVQHRLADRNVRSTERARMLRLAEWAQ
ncbi:MAG TPA: phosphotransferase [Solirubrobacteraceae bacterium]|nr:phosphotransferase [Solirubrobacteraceae bacterium]